VNHKHTWWKLTQTGAVSGEMPEPPWDLRGLDLSGVQLAGADLGQADLSRSILRGADLSGASMAESRALGADFSGAVLKHANLLAADLRGVNFTGTDFTDASLSKACLRGAIIDNAIFDGTSLVGAQMPKGYKDATTLLENLLGLFIGVPLYLALLTATALGVHYVTTVTSTGSGIAASSLWMFLILLGHHFLYAPDMFRGVQYSAPAELKQNPLTTLAISAFLIELPLAGFNLVAPPMSLYITQAIVITVAMSVSLNQLFSKRRGLKQAAIETSSNHSSVPKNQSTGPKSDWRELFLGAGFSLMIVTFACGIIIFGWQNFSKGRESGKWPTTAAIIKRSWVEWKDTQEPPGYYSVHVRYEYQVNGTLYEGQEISLDNWNIYWLESSAEKARAQYTIGHRLPIHYDPTDPDWSVIRPGFTYTWLILLFCGIYLLVIARKIFLDSCREWKKPSPDKETSDTPEE